DWQYNVTQTQDKITAGYRADLRVTAKDSEGFQASKNSYVYVMADTTPPQGTITINNNSQYTNQNQVTLSLLATDSQSGLDKMQFSNDNITWSAPEPYAATKTWDITSGDGEKTVYVKFSDKALNWSQAVSDMIILDTAAPIVTIDPVTTPTTLDNQTITGTKSADAAEVIVTASSANAGPVNYPTPTTWSCYLDSFIEGDIVITVTAEDMAGNISPAVTATITYAPAATISPNIRITNETGDQVNPSIAIYQNTAYAVWQNNNDGKIYFDKSLDGGITWNTLRKVIDTGTSPSIDIDDNGALYLTYTASNTIYFIKSIDGGVTFSGKIAVSSGYLPDIAVTKAGDMVYIIGRHPSNSNILVFKKSINGGITFDYGTSIIDPKSAFIRDDQPKVESSESGRFVYVVFAVRYEPGAIGPYRRSKTVLARSQDYGATFQAPRIIAPQEYNSRYPDIVTFAENEVYIAWQQDEGQGVDYWYLHNYFIKSTDSGSTFGPWIRLDDGNYASTRYDKPALAINDNNNLYATFINFYPNHYLYYDFSEDAGSSFGPDIRIDEQGTVSLSDPPKIATNAQGNNICVIWSDNRDGNYDLYCVKISKGTRPPKPTLNWLKSQISAFGLIDSYEADGRSIGWTYDQALAVLALTKAADFQNAQKMLNALKNIQNPDGSWYFRYYTNGQNADTDYAKYVGTNSWVITAVNYYTHVTGDTSFIPMAEKTANWVLSYQDTDAQSPTFGSITGGERRGVPITWRATEHNVVSYAALRYLSDITDNLGYSIKAENIKDYLLTKIWTGTRFLTGWQDTSEYLDVNSWAVLSLGPAPDGIDITPCLDWAYSKLAIYDDWDAAITHIHGFDENNTYDLPLDKIWSEGSEGMVSAYYRAGDTISAAYFHNQTYRYQQPNGGVPYSTPNNDGGNWPQYNSVAGTAWFYFNESTPPFNPLDPYLTKQ
ncbi:MAG: hypothetical protein PHO42_03595, partial [Candidatus Omnitrophica bacterium]|nr:hypothetical protein [Candidatus Omnitrophota bacterium]